MAGMMATAMSFVGLATWVAAFFADPSGGAQGSANEDRMATGDLSTAGTATAGGSPRVGDEEGFTSAETPYVYRLGAPGVGNPHVVSVDVVAFPGGAPQPGERSVVTFMESRTRAYVRALPRPDARVFGVIPEATSFAVIGAPFEAEGCPRGRWYQVELGGYVCLRHHRATQEAPEVFPSVVHKFSPLLFVRPRRVRDGEEARSYARYHSLWKMKKEQVEDHLLDYGSYGFVRLKRGVFTDIDGRAVRNEHFRRFRPSQFEGLVPAEVGLTGVPADHTLGWTFEPETVVYRDTGRWAKKRRTLKKHTPLVITSQAPELVRGEAWLPIEDGWIRASEVRRWEQVGPPPGFGAQQKWIDVDLDAQILTMYEGAQPIFVTLVTTGRRGESKTPTGTFEIVRKKAIGDLKSKDGVRRPYFVGDVPWIQFFHEGYALHSTYWHNRFGKVGSHGCVNLSMKDAARLFAWTTPEVPAGWNWRYRREGERDRGTPVVIRSASRDEQDAPSATEGAVGAPSP